MKHAVLSLLLAAACLLSARAEESAEGFISLFNGKDLTGWKASENTESWKVKDGLLMCDGPRSHLFYTGEHAPFKNFHFKAEVKTTPGSNAGIYFHTEYQETGWPNKGFEVQVNISHKDPKKSGSLYAVENVDEKTVRKVADDNEWYTQEIIVKGNRVITKINGETLVNYVEPEGKEAFSDSFQRLLSEGTFALQAHDPESVVYFKNLRVKKLDD